ncbi:MAG: family 16 glycoside hydrolase, partial [Verrucomicrobiota bacterium]
MMTLAAQDSGVQAVMDDTQPGWRALTDEDFTAVNSAKETWSWENGVLHCTGQPVSVLRTIKTYQNFEMVVEWSHQKPAGNSGVFLWVTPESIQRLTEAGKPGLPDGIEIQILDHAYTERVKASGGKTDWFGTNGDVF